MGDELANPGNLGVYGLVLSIFGLIIRDLLKERRGSSASSCAPDPAWGLNVKAIRSWLERYGTDIHEKVSRGADKLDDLARAQLAAVDAQREFNSLTREQQQRHSQAIEAFIRSTRQ